MGPQATGALPRTLRRLVVLHRLAPHPAPGVLHNPSGAALARLVRPDGHVGYRCAGYDITDLHNYMARWVGGDAVDPEASLVPR